MRESSFAFSPSWDRRRYSRQPLTANVELNDGKSTAVGVIRDACENGLQIEAIHEFKPGSSLIAFFQAPHDSNWIKLKGQVAWVNNKKNVLGLEFSGLASEARQLLRESLLHPARASKDDWVTDASDDHITKNSSDGTIFSEAEQKQRGEPAKAIGLPGSRFPVAPIETSSHVSASHGLIVLFVCLAVAAAVWKLPTTKLSALLEAISPSDQNQPIPAARIAASSTQSQRPAVPANLAKSDSAPTPAPGPPQQGIVLQVAAMSREQNATALAESLKKKQFPAFVFRRDSDGLYLVYIGPYSSASAKPVKQQLLEQGTPALERPWSP
jgi:cell division septation protein DedD